MLSINKFKLEINYIGVEMIFDPRWMPLLLAVISHDKKKEESII
jgi:hypothetical protein